MKNHFTTLSILAAACIGLAGCGSSQDDLYGRLQAEDPAVRASAAVEAAEQDDKAAIALLVERLNDIDIEVRMMASVALEEITGLSTDYQAWDPPQKRQAVQQQWRQWLAQGAEGPLPPLEQPETQPAPTVGEPRQ